MDPGASEDALSILQSQPICTNNARCVSVCVVGKAFKGLMMQMRAVGDKVPVGTFNGTKGSLPEDTKLMQCTAVDDTITHKRSSLKPSPTCFYWKASENDVTDKLQFV